MVKKIFKILIPLVLAALMVLGFCEASAGTENGAEAKINPKEIIFEHLGDAYGWEVPFAHHHRIPLPVIVYGSDGFHCFSSARVTGGKEWKDGNATFLIPADGENHGKVVEIVDGKEIKPWDISITKNVFALFIAMAIVITLCMSLVSWYRREGNKAPRGFRGACELLIVYIYDSVVKSLLHDKSKRFAPFLLTAFMFIFVMNLLGLIVIFPGGANLTGNIAVTMVMAILTFFATNLFGTKHYWKDVFWPDVPLWLKFPLPIMPLIEVFSVFTKPVALTIRLFANMMGGHIIVIVLTLLIFIFTQVGGLEVGGAMVVVSVGFSVFMLLIDVLVSFIQAYVFTMLSTIFISLAQEDGHGHDAQGETPVHAAN